MSFESSIEHEQAQAAANRISAEAIERSAVIQRAEIINAAFAGVLAYVVRQQEAMAELEEQGTLGKEPFDRYVLQTFSRLPFVGDEPQSALSLLLEPDTNMGQVQKGEEKMMVFLPVPKDVVLDPNFDPDTLERPSFIAVDWFDEHGEVRSFTVSDEKVEEFESAFHTGEQITGEHLFADPNKFKSKLSSRVDPMDKLTGEMIVNLTNWTATAQRSDEPEPEKKIEEDYDAPEDEDTDDELDRDLEA